MYRVLEAIVFSLCHVDLYVLLLLLQCHLFVDNEIMIIVSEDGGCLYRVNLQGGGRL